MWRWQILILFLALTTGSLRAQYVVASGDTLSGIAQKVLGDGNRWPEISKLNQLPRPYRLQVGQKLQMPAGPSVVEKRVPELNPPPAVPVVAVAPPVETDMKQRDVEEAERVAEVVSEIFGQDLSLPSWMVRIRTVFFLSLTTLLLLYVPFWATGVMFAMFLFKQELSRWDAFKTALSWSGILLITLLPISFISFDEDSFKKHLPWICGLGILSFLLSCRAAKKCTGCSTIQSPFVLVFGSVFGWATLETLIYVIGLGIGAIILVSLPFL